MADLATSQSIASRVEPATREDSVAARWYVDKRIGGLARFAVAITVLNVLGHLWLGFEQSWATPLVSLVAAYTTELALEQVSAWSGSRRPRFLGSPQTLVTFLLSAHISGLAVPMLLYNNERLWVIAFASAAAIASKQLFRVAVLGPDGRSRGSRHYFNPSNFAITLTLILFPWVGIAPPYQFTENIAGPLDWVLPLVVITTGSLLNTKLTGRMPLILAWFGAFALQAVLRAAIHGTPFVAGLMPMTGFAFILFSFYMVTDPATTPAKLSHQMVFGAAVALAYALFMELHIVFGMFYALTLVTVLRGVCLAFTASRSTRTEMADIR